MALWARGRRNQMQTEESMATIYQRPAELLQRLIRFNTTNPPGSEAMCVSYLRDLLTSAGIECTLFARDSARPNLIARLPGQGRSAALLLYGHVDVVTTEHQRWTYDPFAAEEHEGFIWGRGALDMKSGIAMMVSAVLRARASGLTPPGDVVLAILSDEEAGGDYGARFMVEQHPEQFTGIRYALGEFGGFSYTVSGHRFYPIMVAEKQCCIVAATVSGPGGHAAFPARNGAMARLATFLRTLNDHRLPVHVPVTTRMMIETMASALPLRDGLLLRQLLKPALTDLLLDRMGTSGQSFDPLLHNTVNATIVRGGEKDNVIPSNVVVTLDGRILPGYTKDDLMRELRALAGKDVDFEVQLHDPGTTKDPDMGLFTILGGVLKELDPEAIPMPLLLGAVTDGRFFSRLGIQTYGYTPMRLPAGWSFIDSVHAADERVPVTAMTFGTDAIYRVLERFAG
jgi:acetylornithine deacetylase/succinyl-diaminopimelate desuccinylase-like protein